jgi:hypothetical protein
MALEPLLLLRHTLYPFHTSSSRRAVPGAESDASSTVEMRPRMIDGLVRG